MKFKIVLMTILLGYSFNVFAIETSNNPVILAKTEFSAEYKKLINDDMDNFGEAYIKALDNLQREYIDFRKEQQKLGKTLPNQESIKFHLDELSKVKKYLQDVPIKTQEVKLIRQSSLQSLNTQIQFLQRELEIGFGKTRTDPQLLALLQKMGEQEKISTKQIDELKEKLK